MAPKNTQLTTTSFGTKTSRLRFHLLRQMHCLTTCLSSIIIAINNNRTPARMRGARHFGVRGTSGLPKLWMLIAVSLGSSFTQLTHNTAFSDLVVISGQIEQLRCGAFTVVWPYSIIHYSKTGLCHTIASHTQYVLN